MLFDLDGVLVDSEGEYTKFWGAMGRRYNVGANFAYDIKGTTLAEILKGFPEDERDGIVRELHEFEKKHDLSLDSGGGKIPAYPF